MWKTLEIFNWRDQIFTAAFNLQWQILNFVIQYAKEKFQVEMIKQEVFTEVLWASC